MVTTGGAVLPLSHLIFPSLQKEAFFVPHIFHRERDADELTPLRFASRTDALGRQVLDAFEPH
ncbi:hypothetical protein [Streptomyces platensis]|uniref:hypothetical protein n=1 Tax=Streptomyces platensis TaxID=58346 RepID=UPI002E2678E9